MTLEHHSKPFPRKGKTECVLKHVGVGANTCRLRAFADSPCLQFKVANAEFRVRLVSEYVHLGTLVNDNCSPVADIRRKFAKALGYLRPLAAKVPRWSDVPMQAKREILQAIGASVAQFDCVVWGKLNKEAAHTWQQGHDAMYRLLLVDDRHTHRPAFPSIYELCGATLLPVPSAKVRALRLFHAERIIKRECVPLWELLDEEDRASKDGRLHALREDLHWLNYWTLREGAVPCADASADEIAVWLGGHSLKCRIRKALTAQAWSLHEWNEFQLRARCQGAFHGVSHVLELEKGPERYQYDSCSFECSTGSQFIAHLTSAHGHVSPTRAYVSGSVCRACMTPFWTSKYLTAHLVAGTPCLATLIVCVGPSSMCRISRIRVPFQMSCLSSPRADCQGPDYMSSRK